MKKNFLSGGYYPKTPSGKKILRTMRISTFLLGACVFCSYAEDSHSQNARVSINKNNSQLEEILNEIESQTDYLFIYNNQVDVNRKVSVKAKTKPVSEVLDNLLRMRVSNMKWKELILFCLRKAGMRSLPLNCRHMS